MKSKVEIALIKGRQLGRTQFFFDHYLLKAVTGMVQSSKTIEGFGNLVKSKLVAASVRETTYRQLLALSLDFIKKQNRKDRGDKTSATLELKIDSILHPKGE